MFCEKCGTKNETNANFCEKCGNPLTPKIEPEKKDLIKEKIKEESQKLGDLPKNTKIAMASVIAIVILAILILGLLLRNPVKKVEDSLNKYYDNYGTTNNKELIDIGNVLKNNKDDAKVLEKIKNTTHNAMESWVKNFNIEYKDTSSLDSTYKKVSNALKDIYNYFDGLEYMLDKELYKKYSEELSTLYYSKHAYLKGLDYEINNDNYNAYYNYQKVEATDIYHYKAEEFINNFVKDEMSALKEKTKSMLTVTNEAQKEAQINEYIAVIKYLNENKKNNNVDLSITEEYKELYEEYSNQILKIVRELVNEYNKEEDYQASLEILEKSLNVILNKEIDAYKEIEKLQETTKDMMPTSLFLVHRESYQGVSYSTYPKTINEKEYKSNLNFVFNGNTASTVYNLEGKYKRFKTSIVRDIDYPEDFNGYFVISGDNLELYKSEIITPKNEITSTIDIDISNVQDLKIEFITTSKGTGWNYHYIYLVEPYLYK